MNEIDKLLKHTNILLDALCCIANEDEESPVTIAEDAFDALDRGDGKNNYVFQCDGCNQWKIRSLEYGKFGECEDCYDQETI